MSRSSIHTLLAVFVLLLAAQPPAAAAQPSRPIRVHLFAQDAPQSAVLRAEGRLTFYAGAYDAPLAHLEPGQEATLSVRATDVRVTLPEGTLFAQTLRIVPAPETRWHLTPLDAEMRTYTGALRVEPLATAALRLVNEAPLEDYVAGVVASEYGLGDLAGAKAMAVTARTYALRHIAGSDAPFIQTDGVRAQVYRGVGDITPTARRAARETRGEVLTYDGQLIEAVYFSSSGGATADNEDVWAGRPLPYLRGRSDPYAGASPHQHWQVTVDRNRLLDRLSAHYGFEVQGFLLGEQSEDGRVGSVELLGPGERTETLQANAFRLFVNAQLDGRGVQSTFFDAQRIDDHYVFEGKGYGHGVGLSQYGAHAMAEQGHGYRDILRYYYTDVRLAHLNALDVPLPMPNEAVAQRTPPASEEPPASPDRRIGW